MIDSKQNRARELEREYLREWRRKNSEKMRQYRQNYWLRKAEAERVDNEQKAISKNP